MTDRAGVEIGREASLADSAGRRPRIGNAASARGALRGACAIGRRTFLSETAIGVALAALAACSRDITAPDPGIPIGNSVSVADFPELAVVGGVVLVSLDGTPLALIRTGDASFLALSRVCPHKGAIVSKSAGGFRCPRHGARFDADGTWVGGERTSSLRARATSFDASTGVLTIV